MKKDERIKIKKQELRCIKHYSSGHKILLVGEGDFSFSACLAKSFQSATHMVATSLDPKDVVIAKYKYGKANLEVLKKLGCKIVHEVDVHAMTQHPYLNTTKYDRIVYNFPHAGFQYSESNLSQIKLHQKVVRGFLQSARDMLVEDGEVHVTHKTTFPFSLWKVDKLGEEVGLQIVEEALFSKLDYPGYANKKGDGPQSDLSFPVGCSSTFKFSLLKKQMRDFSATAHDPENKNFEDYGPKTESTHHSTVCMEWWKTFALPAYYFSENSCSTEEDDLETGDDEIIRWEENQELRRVSQYLNQGRRSQCRIQKNKKIRPKWRFYSVFDLVHC